MRKSLLLVVLVIFACTTKKDIVDMEAEQKEDMVQSVDNNDDTVNPLLEKSSLPYGAPDFDKIEIRHFKPAITATMQDQLERIDAISSQKTAPTFDNTILPLEKSGSKLRAVLNVFYALTGTNTNDELKALQKEFAPKFSNHQDAIYLNESLFDRISFIYGNLNDLKGEDKVLVKEYYDKFVLAGANLSQEKKDKLKQLNAEEASLQTNFNQTLLSGTQSACIHFDEVDHLAGLTESEVKALSSDKGGYDVKLINTTQQPILTNLANREGRKAVYDASYHRTDHGEHNTSETVLQLAKLRAEKGKLLGYDNYAEWKLQKTMVKTPQKVLDFFAGITPSAKDKANTESNDIKAMMQKEGATHHLEAYDWNYYAEKVRKEKYDLDESEIRPYFELINVLENGVFYAAEKLYGITAKKRTDIPTYHPDVLVYELFEEDGSKLGLFYGDYFARDSKRGGAWMSNFVTQSHLEGNKPVIYNVMNVPPPAAGEAALLSFDNVTTLFHEFGHALHGFFADQKYPSLSGTSVARDFVEFPSQFNEYWALYPEVLNNYAYHYKTKKAMPQTLVEKIKNAATFNQGYSLVELLGAANLDILWHTLSTDEHIDDVEEFERTSLDKLGLWVENIPPRYRSTYFAHVFGGGYAAGYYSYQWTEMLAHDANAWFEENGGLNRKNGQRYRDMVISRGNTLDYEKMYQDFAGRDPKIDPMLYARGLK